MSHGAPMDAELPSSAELRDDMRQTIRQLRQELDAARAELARVTALREAAQEVVNDATYYSIQSSWVHPQAIRKLREALAQASERAAGSGEGDK